MQASLENPAFVVYAVTCLVLCLNLQFVWSYRGVARGKTKTAINNSIVDRAGKQPWRTLLFFTLGGLASPSSRC